MTQHELVCLMAAILAIDYEDLSEAMADAIVLEQATKRTLEAMAAQPQLRVVGKEDDKDV